MWRIGRKLKWGVGILAGTAIGLSLYDLYSERNYVRGDRFPGVKESFVSVPKRTEILSRLKSNELYDILVVGGGATGTGIALDAATRGLKVALVERDDFASGTSSRSTKLIHGGVRYLEHAVWHLDSTSLHLVFEALRERSTFLEIAPHLTNPLPIMTPCFKWWEGPYYWIGLKCYDFLAFASGKKAMYPAHWLSAKESLQQFSMLSKKGLKGSVVYYDGQMDDARVNLSLALTASVNGAAVANHVEVVELLKNEENGKICGAKLKDLMTGDEWNVHAKVVVNSTGPFSDSIRKLDEPNTKDMISPSSGVHIILPEYYSSQSTGLIIPKTSDGRVIFMLPWQGHTLAGTTDSSAKITQFPHPHEDEINFILETISGYLTVEVRRSDVLSAWSGIRPLAVDPRAKDTASTSRDHVVEVSKNGLVSIAGGKWTTYRKMAEDVVDKAIEIGGLTAENKCATEHTVLLGGKNWEMAFFSVLRQDFQRMKKINGVPTLVPIPSDIAKHLSSAYGTRSIRVAQIAQEGYGDRIAERHPYIEAEIIYAVREEYALTAVDVLARRTRLAFLDTESARAAAPRVIELMANELGWSEERKKKEYRDTNYFLHIMTVGKGGKDEFNDDDETRAA